ncbi:MAG: thiamine phosphate synthase [Gammaproteobacteria bacterium]|nr:MAG: thiamine phosphate synthase [Gammaproteobacteria bacterium]RLA24202.1 MAG: thiamine phosphate synthase [Gammaproteobacteria bacterium]
MTSVELPKRGLYAITGEFKSHHQLIDDVGLAIQGGAVMIQYRDKKNALPDQREIAKQLLTLCNQHATPLIINDNIELAKTVGAHGVHLGKSDCDLAQAKACLPEKAIIGISCYNTIQSAIEAEENGASYIAFGRFFPSKSKPGASTAKLETLTHAKQLISIPVTAIGGITADNASSLLQAGADLLAVIDAVFGEEHPGQAARKFLPLFK